MSRNLPHGSGGFLVSCDPRHEGQCYQESYILLAEQIESRYPELAERLGGADSKQAGKIATGGADSDNSAIAAAPAAGISDAVAKELKALRETRKTDAVMSRVDFGVQGSVFLRVRDEMIVVEDVIEGVLRSARESGNPGSRHSVRFVPIHSTCYAKAEDAAAAAAKVCLQHFPPGKCSYSIQFRGRMNTGAKRDDYIKAVAGAIEAAGPDRFKVDLTNSDVVLVVEVIKTQCVMGVCRYFYELAKLNIREVCKPLEIVEAEKKKIQAAAASAAKRKEEEAAVAKMSEDEPTAPAEAMKPAESTENLNVATTELSAVAAADHVDAVVEKTETAAKAADSVIEPLKALVEGEEALLDPEAEAQVPKLDEALVVEAMAVGAQAEGGKLDAALVEEAMVVEAALIAGAEIAEPPVTEPTFVESRTAFEIAKVAVEAAENLAAAEPNESTQ